jgi:hypothetical protein
MNHSPKKSWKWTVAVLLLIGLWHELAPAVHAAPILQLYVEGATYDNASESWVFNDPNATSIRLWTIGNVAGPGGHGPISNVRLAVVYSAVEAGIQLHLDPSTTKGLGGFVDPSTPAVPTLLQTQTNGSIRPLLSDGSPLAPHGTYVSTSHWQEFALGDFTLTDSPIADFITSFPTAPSQTRGQINVYEIVVSGGTGNLVNLHFDLYDSVEQGNSRTRAVFAPFSHDAKTLTGVAPEPSSLALALTGLVGWGVARWRGRKCPEQ